MSQWVENSVIVHCKKAPFDVYIGRPSKWGNPYSHKADTRARFVVKDREEAILKFEEYVRSQPDMVKDIKKELRGKTLGCWCAPQACHGDVLMKIANEE